MLGPMLDDAIAKLAPHFDTIRDIARAEGEKINAKLDMLIMVCAQDAFDTGDPRMRLKVPQSAAAVGVELGTVKQGEIWELQAVACLPGAPPVTVTIRDGTGGPMLYTKTFAAAGTEAGQEISIPSGALLTMDISGAAEVYMEFLRRMPQSRGGTNHGGRPEVREPGGMPRTEPSSAHGPGWPHNGQTLTRTAG